MRELLINILRNQGERSKIIENFLKCLNELKIPSASEQSADGCDPEKYLSDSMLLILKKLEPFPLLHDEKVFSKLDELITEIHSDLAEDLRQKLDPEKTGYYDNTLEIDLFQRIRVLQQTLLLISMKNSFWSRANKLREQVAQSIRDAKTVKDVHAVTFEFKHDLAELTQSFESELSKFEAPQINEEFSSDLKKWLLEVERIEAERIMMFSEDILIEAKKNILKAKRVSEIFSIIDEVKSNLLNLSLESGEYEVILKSINDTARQYIAQNEALMSEVRFMQRDEEKAGADESLVREEKLHDSEDANEKSDFVVLYELFSEKMAAVKTPEEAARLVEETIRQSLEIEYDNPSDSHEIKASRRNMEDMSEDEDEETVLVHEDSSEELNKIQIYIKSSFQNKLTSLFDQKIADFSNEASLYQNFQSLITAGRQVKKEIENSLNSAKKICLGLHISDRYYSGLISSCHHKMDELIKAKAQKLIKPIADRAFEKLKNLEASVNNEDSAILVQKAADILSEAETQLQTLGFHPKKDKEQFNLYQEIIEKLNIEKRTLIEKIVTAEPSPKTVIMDYITNSPRFIKIILGVTSLLCLKFILPAVVIAAIAKIGIKETHALLLHASRARLLIDASTVAGVGALSSSVYYFFRNPKSPSSRASVPSRPAPMNQDIPVIQEIVQVAKTTLAQAVVEADAQVQAEQRQNRSSFLSRLTCRKTPLKMQAESLKALLKKLNAINPNQKDQILSFVINVLSEQNNRAQPAVGLSSLSKTLASNLKKHFELPEISTPALIRELQALSLPRPTHDSKQRIAASSSVPGASLR